MTRTNYWRAACGAVLMILLASVSLEAHPRQERIRVQIGGVGGPATLPPLPTPGSEGYAAALDAYFRDLAADDRFAGSVLVVENGRTVFEGAYGLADRSWKVPNHASTRFDVGSINKSFTKVAIGQLLAAGKLRLDDTLADLLPDYPHPENARRITIRHLLEHSSGLGDIFRPEYFEAAKPLFRVDEDYFPLFAHEPLLFEPGTSRRYSNAGYIVLGAIVARVSGMAYTDYVERNVFAPAGMKSAGFPAADEIHRDVAVPYTRMGSDGAPGDVLRPAIFMKPIRGMGAGGACLTAAELAAFDRALRSHHLLPPRYTAWYFTGELPETADDAPATDETGIAGGGPGVSAILESGGGRTVVVLSNLDPPTAEEVGIALARSLREAAQ